MFGVDPPADYTDYADHADWKIGEGATRTTRKEQINGNILNTRSISWMDMSGVDPPADYTDYAD